MLTTSFVAQNEMIWIGCGRYTLKSKVLGPSRCRFREIEFLGRRPAWTLSGITYEADLKNVRIMLVEWSMTSCNEVVSPGVEMNDQRRQRYRSQVQLRICTSAPWHVCTTWPRTERTCLFATKEVARTMSASSTKDVVKLERILRYVRGHPRGRLLFEWPILGTTSPLLCFAFLPRAAFAACIASLFLMSALNG